MPFDPRLQLHQPQLHKPENDAITELDDTELDDATSLDAFETVALLDSQQFNSSQFQDEFDSLGIDADEFTELAQQLSTDASHLTSLYPSQTLPDLEKLETVAKQSSTNRITIVLNVMVASAAGLLLAVGFWGFTSETTDVSMNVAVDSSYLDSSRPESANAGSSNTVSTVSKVAQSPPKVSDQLVPEFSNLNQDLAQTEPKKIKLVTPSFNLPGNLPSSLLGNSAALVSPNHSLNQDAESMLMNYMELDGSARDAFDDLEQDGKLERVPISL